MQATKTLQVFALLASSVLVSCQPAPFAPRYELMQSRPTALLIGNLTVQDGCVWIVTMHARYLGLWPSNFKMAADGAGFTVRGDGVEVSSGDIITVGGGEYAPEQRVFVEELIDQRVPANCRDGYWLVTTILPEPP